MKKLLISFALFGLTACTSIPVPTKDSILIPDNRILADGRQYIALSKNSGQIIIKRDSGLVGIACTTKIYIDAKPVADLDESEKVIFNLPEGEYILSAEPNGLCGGILTEIKVNVKANSQSVYRYAISLYGGPAIYPTAF